MAVGERLKRARKMAGMSQQELGEVVGVSRMSISKYERNEMDPSSKVLIALARALDVKVEYLLRPVSVQLSAPAFRKRTRLPKKREDAIVEHVRDWMDRYLAIEDLLGERLSFSLPDIDRRISSVAEAERVAMGLRHAWDLGYDAIGNLTEILEHRGIKVGIVDGHNDFDALTLWAGNDIPVIVVKEGIPGDRQRLNLAHELGHLLLEMPDEWDHKQEEAAAYRFAGALLMPAEDANRVFGGQRAKVDLNELYLFKHAYGMSMQAIVRRAKDLGLISDNLYEQVCRKFGRQGWRKVEPGAQVAPERPTRMKRLILRALAEEIITRSRAAELQKRPLVDFWETERQYHDAHPEPVRP